MHLADNNTICPKQQFKLCQQAKQTINILNALIEKKASLNTSQILRIIAFYLDSVPFQINFFEKRWRNINTSPIKVRLGENTILGQRILESMSVLTIHLGLMNLTGPIHARAINEKLRRLKKTLRNLSGGDLTIQINTQQTITYFCQLIPQTNVGQKKKTLQ